MVVSAQAVSVNLLVVFVHVKADGAGLAAFEVNVASELAEIDDQSHRAMILILSGDAVAAALMGALIETLGYSIRFAHSSEHPDESIRRVRPKVCLLDCDDPSACNDEILGRATMRGISVVIFGTRQAIERVRTLVTEHDIDMLLVPPDPEILDETLRTAMLKAG